MLENQYNHSALDLHDVRFSFRGPSYTVTTFVLTGLLLYAK